MASENKEFEGAPLPAEAPKEQGTAVTAETDVTRDDIDDLLRESAEWAR